MTAHEMQPTSLQAFYRHDRESMQDYVLRAIRANTARGIFKTDYELAVQLGFSVSVGNRLIVDANKIRPRRKQLLREEKVAPVSIREDVFTHEDAWTWRAV
jgi:hypothetical protein